VHDFVSALLSVQARGMQPVRNKYSSTSTLGVLNIHKAFEQ
jgi:hypothetical protein